MIDSSRLELKPLSKERFSRTWRVAEAGIVEGVTPGLVVGLWEKAWPDQIQVGAWGQRRLIPSPLPMHAETPFDLASVTKVCATALLAAVLVDRRWLSWDTPVCQVFPEYLFKNIEIRHLLSHTAGLVYWLPFWQTLKEQFAPLPLYAVPVAERQKAMRQLVLQVVPESSPGQKAVYSDVSFLLLGFLLEEVVQMPLDQAIARWVWKPLGIQGAWFQRVQDSPESSILSHVAATEVDTWRGSILQGQVHDDNAWAMGGFGGHAGMFGAARDVLHLARSLMTTRFLSPMILHSLWTRVLEPPACDRTLGWDTPTPSHSSVGQEFSPRTVGHLGFTGTSLWLDLEAELAITLLSNRVHPSRENIKIREFRPLMHNAIRLDLRGN